MPCRWASVLVHSAVVMRDRAWCQMTGWRLRLGQACTMTTLRGKPGSPPATNTHHRALAHPADVARRSHSPFVWHRSRADSGRRIHL